MFERDAHAIVCSKAFRRLADKSQIVVKPESNDHFRSRLTHTLEVMQIAETIGLRLGLNLNLIRAIALGHDIGHTPFGHAGERELARIVREEISDPGVSKVVKLQLPSVACNPLGELGASVDPGDHHCFHHATNSVRVLQRKLGDISPLTLSGIQTHGWAPWHQQTKHKFGVPATYEAQAVAIADQIAGLSHDIEDILTWEHLSGYNMDRFLANAHDFLSKWQWNTPRGSEPLQSAMSWFLPNSTPSCAQQTAAHNKTAKERGFGRKPRLQGLIADVVEKSLESLLLPRIATTQDVLGRTLMVSPFIGALLDSFEQYVRTKILQQEVWFLHRDALAASVIRATYGFLKFLRRADFNSESEASDDDNTTERLLSSKESQDIRKSFFESIDSENYNNDNWHTHTVTAATACNIKDFNNHIDTVDYISGMTDSKIKSIFECTYSLFAKE